jgi:2-oxoacid dehydrogenases acyltransferase (catalytic domain)
VRDNAPYRRVMPYLMRGRNESVVYFEQEHDLTKTLPFIERFNKAHPDTPVSLFHVVAWAAVKTLDERPNLNRFVAGGRVFQRDGIWISYSAKKEKADGSPIVVLKRRFDPDEPFDRMVDSMYGELRTSRSDDESYTDKELGLVLKAQGLPLRALMALERFADAFGLLPGAYIRNDPMFASLFIANLGSLKMDSGYHHLYEYGNIPIFCVIGRTRETPIAVDGKVKVRKIATLRFSYDERIEDGLYAQSSLERFRTYVEDPEGAGLSI